MAEIVKKMEDAGAVHKRGEFEMPPVGENGVALTPIQELALAQEWAAQRMDEIRRRYTRRMHDLSEFMNEAFASARERFGAKRKDGARKLKGGGAAASGTLWSLKDLRKGIA